MTDGMSTPARVTMHLESNCHVLCIIILVKDVWLLSELLGDQIVGSLFTGSRLGGGFAEWVFYGITDVKMKIYITLTTESSILTVVPHPELWTLNNHFRNGSFAILWSLVVFEKKIIHFPEKRPSTPSGSFFRGRIVGRWKHPNPRFFLNACAYFFNRLEVMCAEFRNFAEPRPWPCKKRKIQRGRRPALPVVSTSSFFNPGRRWWTVRLPLGTFREKTTSISWECHLRDSTHLRKKKFFFARLFLKQCNQLKF